MSGEPPQVIGPFRILEILGEGGMGTVYLAEQKEPVRRRVALKVIKLGMDSKAVLARFEHERQALALMQHDGIAKVHDAGTTESGQPFFVMEYIDGVPLAQFCEQSRLDLAQRLALFKQVCAAVQHAHQKGVVHRDLKPSNVLVTNEGGKLQPKIIDFGLAKAVGQKLIEASLFTEAGQIIGTPEYMAPEQADPMNADIDTRADIYSLGVMLYEVLVGQLPFTQQELRNAGLMGMRRLLCEVEPPKPSARLSSSLQSSATAAARRMSLGALQRALKNDLDWVVLKALEKDRNRRYDTAAGLAADLKRFLDHEPLVAGPPSAAYRLRKLVRRYRGQVVAGAAVLLTAVVGALIAIDYAVLANDRAAQMARLARQKGELANATSLALDQFNLLADVVKLREAKEVEQTLYPAFPEQAPELQKWLDERGLPLSTRLPVVRRARDQVRARGVAVAATAATSSRPTATSASTSAATIPMVVFDFPNEADRFLHETLSKLVEDLEAFVGEKGELSAVHQRLAEAGSVRKKTIEDHQAEWDAAISAIAKSDGVVASRLYDHLVLEPQLGLVPIGMDPASKLWEFAHLASGELAKRRPRDQRMFLKDETGIVFVLLPAGEFWMGAQKDGQNAHAQPESNESPVHVVKLSAFFLSKYELTQGQWLRLSGGQQPSWYRVGQRYQGIPELVGYTTPVETVSWEMCDTLLTRHGVVLPTEAQWEYACRAGTSSRWWCGGEAKDLAGCANILDLGAEKLYPQWGRQQGDFDDGHAGPAPVGSYRANDFGLHDMPGNVWEWCRDWHLGYANPVRDGDGLRLGDPASYRVLRGGSFSNAARYAGSAHRYANAPAARTSLLGVRAARVVSP